MPSDAYQLFHEAMATKKQIVCTYNGLRREVCPVILGHSRNGEEKALTYQFGGDTSSVLPAGGEWRCLTLSKVGEIELRDGPWRTGGSHSASQSCVDVVDFDVNPRSPYSPKHRL
ncbi:hypothetical protein [Devosia sp. A16]|uniref:hypothetical protein n=1 Tax=Devosia sp. A16 TaxID=1736675 RepID=UPI0006D7B288|nr:hypothetical protein [Devosia sp. A16]